MRAVALSLAVSLFGCSPAVDYVAPDPGGAGSPLTSPVLPGSGALVPSSGAAASLPAPELCFAVDPALDAALPTARERLLDAAEAWRRPIRFGDDCALRFGYEPMSIKLDDGRTLWPYGRGLPNESLVLSRDWTTSKRLVDKSPADCVEGEALLLSVLIHELGHVFNLGHMPNGSGGAMEQGYSSCEVLLPSEVEIAAAATR
jgi:hypothetical protein